MDQRSIAKMKGHRHLTIVIKIGTSSIVDEVTHEPILPILSLIVDTAIKLRRDGHRVVLVSSGAIGVGLQRMNIAKRPKHLPQTQILLTRNDIAEKSQYVNAQNTFSEVLNYGVIPIVNENDTLAVSEIKFGDNDTLSAITAAMVHADYLFLMTDVEALYDKNPRLHADAQPIRTIEDIDLLKADVSSRGSSLGTGGMATKIIAARLATSAGTTTIITKSSKPGNIKDIIRFFHPPETKPGPNGSDTLSNSTIIPEPPLHTRFIPSPTPIRSRAFWILHGLVPQGTIYIDRGASKALHNKANLLPIGVVDVQGDFGGQEAVRLVVVDRNTYPYQSTTTTSNPTPSEDLTSSISSLTTLNPSRPSSPRTKSLFNQVQGEEIGRALSNFSADQMHRIKGLRSRDIAKVLGYADTEYVAFRENVSLTTAAATASTTNQSSRPTTPGAGETRYNDSGTLEQTTPRTLMDSFEKGSITPLGDRTGATAMDADSDSGREGTSARSIESSLADLKV